MVWESLNNKETAAQHNFEMLKQSLVDQIKFAAKETADAKKNLAGSQQKKAFENP